MLPSPVAREALSGARGGLVTISVGDVFSRTCGRAVKFIVEYVRSAGGLPRPTRLGSITIDESDSDDER